MEVSSELWLCFRALFIIYCCKRVLFEKAVFSGQISNPKDILNIFFNLIFNSFHPQILENG